jgi:hypothetical protein
MKTNRMISKKRSRDKALRSYSTIRNAAGSIASMWRASARKIAVLILHLDLHLENSVRDAASSLKLPTIALDISLWFSLARAFFRFGLKPIFLEDSTGFQMSNIEKFPRDAIEMHDAAMASANTMAATIQTIATTHVEYTRKTIQDGTDFLTKLTSLQSPDRAIGLQTEFAGKSYQAFVQEMRKISELYVDLLEHACKPFEAFANH